MKKAKINLAVANDDGCSNFVLPVINDLRGNLRTIEGVFYGTPSDTGKLPSG
jgi:hypothetical protein